MCMKLGMFSISVFLTTLVGGGGGLLCKISYMQVNMAYALCSFYATVFLNCVYAKSEKCLKSQMCRITHALPCKQKRLWCC
jgi:hypothetical protein